MNASGYFEDKILLEYNVHQSSTINDSIAISHLDTTVNLSSM